MERERGWGKGQGQRAAQSTAVPDVCLIPMADAPSFGEVDCPGAWTWVKGSDHQFSCEADGNPEPVVLCARAGNLSHEELLFPHLVSHLGHDPTPGLYYCNATNTHGSASKTVTISAECKLGTQGLGCRGLHKYIWSPVTDKLILLPSSPTRNG